MDRRYNHKEQENVLDSVAVRVLTYRPEGQGALKSFLQGWKQYSVCEKQQEVGDQASVLGQIRFSVEARMLRGR